jgi:hypothetical protein
MPIARTVFAVLAWLFVALVVLQVFYAGVGLLGGGGMDQHREFGYLVSMVPLLALVAAIVARAGRLAWMSAALLLLAQVQTMLPWFAEDAPVVAALHPVNALVLFGLGLAIAQRATALARRRTASPTEAPTEAPTETQAEVAPASRTA